MPDWKNEADYEFKDPELKERWVWEFLRRNPEYRADYAAVPALTTKQMDRMVKAGAGKHFRPLFPPQKVLGGRWRLRGEIRDPASDDIPDFLYPLIVKPLLNEVVRYFFPPEDDGYAEQRPAFAVLVFHLGAALDLQLYAAQGLLNDLQKQQKLKPPRRSFTLRQFPTYLRVLDAKQAGAKTKEIVAHIAAYKSVKHKTGADWEYAAQKRIQSDRKKAERILANPWSLLA